MNKGGTKYPEIHVAPERTRGWPTFPFLEWAARPVRPGCVQWGRWWTMFYRFRVWPDSALVGGHTLGYYWSAVLRLALIWAWTQVGVFWKRLSRPLPRQESQQPLPNSY